MITISRVFPWVGFGRSSTVGLRRKTREPLREFVYLDEVSVASLLASQKGELTENITAQSQEGWLTEAGGKIGSNLPLGPSAEIASRFQTTNSSTLQTVRKANAQSLFRELHGLEELRRIQPTRVASAARSAAEFFAEPPVASLYKVSDLQRGDLVEFRVKLSASWIFQMSTLVAEFSDMFDESPTLFMEHVRFTDVYQAKNANKIINRLLAGLVPISGFAPDYSVVIYNGEEYIAHNDAISGIEIDKKPLQIVGVTEHLAYWKDIRRILFADNEFTVLARIAKPGVQHDWNPIKLADIFKDFAPDLANEIEASTRSAMVRSLDQPSENTIEPNVMRLMSAMVRYKEIILSNLKQEISEDHALLVSRAISELKVSANTAEEQRAAFSLVRTVIRDITEQDIGADADLRAREQVRKELNVPLFPSASSERETNLVAEPSIRPTEASRLLDVEVVAIYW